MKKTTVHIISHSHWDREWYMAFEQHRLRLVRLIDDAMELFEKDEGFHSFHLDGQTIVLDDYLEIRPQNREKILKYIEEGRFIVGPWYILQDEFLTSGEANVRNLLVGAQEAKVYGKDCKIGYFPDAFGNAGQMPQLLLQAGMKAVVFGRGVKPVGADNQVIEDGEYESAFSEMFWSSPDGSSLPGILFANWYNNGSEIPTDEAQAKEYWDERLEKAQRYAGTSQLLLMNGCDHQPVQKDLGEAIAVARKLYPEIEFVHSDFPSYVRAIREEMDGRATTVTGELIFQKTDGLTTLVNTSSNRVDLKIRNRECEIALEKEAEPLAAIAFLNGQEYPQDQLRYAWKTLMQNHPHDSICGCSVDAVNREIAARFDKSLAAAQGLAEESRGYLADRIGAACFADCRDLKRAFAVFNGAGWEKTQVISVLIDWQRDWQTDRTAAYDSMESIELPDFVLRDADGNAVEAVVEDAGVHFGYTLPADRFRRPYMARQVRVTFEAKAPALGYASYVLAPAETGDTSSKAGASLVSGPRAMENDFLRVEIAEDGSYTVTDKKNGVTYPAGGWFEDCGDIGNEYIFVQPKGTAGITTRGKKADVELVEDTPVRAVFAVTHRLSVPVSADEQLVREQERMVNVHERTAQRSREMTELTLVTRLTLEKSSKGLLVETAAENHARDHRVCVVIPTGQKADVHFADSTFEVAKRPNRHAQTWKNPSGCEHQQNFVAVCGENAGLLVANFGLYEYEILPEQDNAIAVTLLRCVGEMGDWGVFPTPDAQMQGRYTLKYEIVPFAAQELTEAYKEGYLFQSGLTVCQIPGGCCGTVPPFEGKEQRAKRWEGFADSAMGQERVAAGRSFLNWQGEGLALTGFKRSEAGEEIIARFVNVTDKAATLRMEKMFWMKGAGSGTVLEEKKEALTPGADGWYERSIAPFEIATFILETER